MNLSCFKAYDIRGRVPSVLNESLARQIGYAYALEFSPKTVVIGYDARLSGPALYGAVAEGLNAAGVDVTGIGMCGTEEIYYSTFAKGFDGGIMITGSHNPADENGMKMVRRGAVPVSGDSGLFNIRNRIEDGLIVPSVKNGSFSKTSFRDDYIRHLLGYIAPETLKPFTVVADAGNGCAGLVMKELAAKLPLNVTILNAEPDGRFPHGVPNPLLPEKRETTSAAVKACQADFGIAWDGDFDRCFFYDASGRFIEGYYLVGMIAEALLSAHPRENIIHDPRLTWNTQEIVRRAKGNPVESKTGHAFIKERMRAENAVYGGEMSAHHYFREFAYCDSGMIPWLLVAQYLSQSGKTLAQCVDESIRKFPCSGEINSVVRDIPVVIQKIESVYSGYPGVKTSRIDGLSMEFEDWRFNLRGSNTEPVLRLNVESRGDIELMQKKIEELLKLIRSEN